MEGIDNKQVETLLEDIASIKEVINRNKPIIQWVVNLAHFRLLMFLSGISISIFSILIYFLIVHYGRHSAIPTNLKWIVYVAIVLTTILLTIFKQRLYLSSIKKMDKSLTLSWWFKELFSNRFIHIYFSGIFLILFLIVFFVIKDLPYFIVPTICIWFGLLGVAGAMLYIRHSLVVGYWFLASGILLIIFNAVPAPLAVFISFGIGFLLLSALGYLDQKSGKVA